MTTLTTLTDQLRVLFLESFHMEVPSTDADLLQSGILDSLQFVELLVQLEQRFGLRIAIDDIDLDDLRTLDSLARLLARAAAVSDPPMQPSSEPA